MAEGLARKLAQDKGMELEFRSAGVSALDGQAISDYSAQILREHGIADSFVSRSLTDDTVQWADLILTMTQSHKRLVISRYPDAVEKTFTLKEYVEDDEAALGKIAENEQLIADAQVKQALGETITEEQRKRLSELQKTLPNHEIADPFGCDLETYRRCAEEIRECLDKLLRKISG